ncbi:hypothetical protein TcCL_NonESM08543 [Trypanosoma cruzi]|nr:hypothetical protein TcCL_NonESM08543 [Trypanosoma cruzi]
MGCCSPKPPCVPRRRRPLAVARPRGAAHPIPPPSRSWHRREEDMLMTPSCYFPPLVCWSLAPARCGRQGPVLPPPVAPHGREWTHRRHDSCEHSCGAGPRQARRRWLQGGGLLRLTHHTKQHVLATQLRAQRQTFRQSEAGGVPPQRSQTGTGILFQISTRQQHGAGDAVDGTATRASSYPMVLYCAPVIRGWPGAG